jgi:hypothetical protein
MAAMHESFVRLAKVRSVATLADLIGDDKAGVALRLEIPGMVEAWRRSRRITVPADARIGYEFVDLALERQTERRPRNCEGCWSCCLSFADQPGNHGIEGNGAHAVFAGTLKVDPAFVEAIDHADAWQGVLHA